MPSHPHKFHVMSAELPIRLPRTTDHYPNKDCRTSYTSEQWRFRADMVEPTRPTAATAATGTSSALRSRHRRHRRRSGSPRGAQERERVEEKERRSS